MSAAREQSSNGLDSILHGTVESVGFGEPQLRLLNEYHCITRDDGGSLYLICTD